MSKLNNLINYFKQATANFNEIETIRYIYLYLGKMFHFDINFAFGNSKTKNKIYRECLYNETSFNENLDTNNIICKSLAYLFEYILKALGFNAISVSGDFYHNDFHHIYNHITLKNGTTYSFDLESDLKYIQGHFRTRYFGIGVTGSSLSPLFLEKIDLKLGAITSEKYYADDYYYLLKSVTDLLSFEEKVPFILNNLDVYNDTLSMKYVEFKDFFIKNLALYLTPKERRKTHVFDLFDIKSPLDYILCIMIDISNNEKIIYLYDRNLKCFRNISLSEFLDMNLSSKIKLPKLKRNKPKESLI